MVQPPPPYVVHGPQLFWIQSGIRNHARPLPRPREAFPAGSSTIGKIPIWGPCSVSWRKRYLKPSSTSPHPDCVRLPNGWFHAHGTTRWSWRFGAAPRLNSRAGPWICLPSEERS